MVSQRRADRAKLFAPFAALKGFYELILAQEATREQRQDLCEDDAAEMSERLKQLDKGVNIHIRYYDKIHYVTISGEVREIDYDFRFLIVDEHKIWFDDVFWLEMYTPEGKETWLK